MRHKFLVGVMAVTMVWASLSGCTETSNGSNSSSNEETAVYGQVSKVKDDEITIKLGTLNEDKRSNRKAETSSESNEENNEQSKEEQGDSDAENNKKDNTKENSLINLNGKEETITITDDTTITKEKMHMGGQNEMPQMKEGETPPAKPEGESNNDNLSGKNELESREATSTEETTQMTLKVSDISEGDIVEVKYDSKGNAQEVIILSGNMNFPENGINGQPGGENQSVQVTNYDAVNEYLSDSTVDGESIL